MKRSDWAERPERSNLALLRLMTWLSLRLGRPFGDLVLTAGGQQQGEGDGAGHADQAKSALQGQGLRLSVPCALARFISEWKRLRDTKDPRGRKPSLQDPASTCRRLSFAAPARKKKSCADACGRPAKPLRRPARTVLKPQSM